MFKSLDIMRFIFYHVKIYWILPKLSFIQPRLIISDTSDRIGSKGRR